MAASPRGRSFGQRRPPLSVTITGILEEYPDGQIFKEIIQNADDAGARMVRFYLDNRQHGTQSLVHQDLARFQGPALLAYNDSKFKDEDWEGIQNLQRSGKRTDPMKVGKFGIGFNSVYHITDMPVIVSGEEIGYLEPQEVVWPRESGWMCSISDCHRNSPDSVSPFLGIGGFSVDTTSFDGTIFRFPLRNKSSELSKKLYSIEKLHELIGALKKEAKVLLLFLRSVDTVEVYEIDAQGRQSELFRVTIAEKDKVHQERVSFNAKLESANHQEGYAISHGITLETSFHVQVTDHTVSPSTENSHWLLASRVGSSDRTVLKAATEQCVFPWAGTALELSNTNTLPPGGRVFCFLPMPEEASCHLPVHVNGTFGVDKDRRALKWPSAERIDDPTANWNVLLVKQLLPSCYAALLTEAKQMLTPEAFYQAWPNVNTIECTNWKELLNPLFSTLFKTPVFWSQAPQALGQWVTLNEGLFVPQHLELAQIVQVALSRCNLKLVSIPDQVWAALCYCRHSVCQVLPSTARAAFRNNPHSYTQESHPNKLELLRYCLSDRAYHDLHGLALLPLANNAFTTFDRCSAYICSDVCPRSLLPNLDHKLVDLSSYNPELHGSLQEVARSNYTNLRELIPRTVVDLITQAMPQEWQGVSIVSLPHPQFPSEWFRVFWEWASRHKCIQLFTDKLVVPFRPSSQKLSASFWVSKLATNTPMVFISNYESYPTAILGTLEKLKVYCILQSDFPYVSYSEYFHRLTVNGVLDAISKTSVKPQTVSLTVDEASSLRDFLSTQINGYTYSFQRHATLQNLPIFTTSEDPPCIRAVSQIGSMSVLGTPIVQPENFDLFSAEYLPRNLMLFSRHNRHQNVLLRHMGVASPDLFGFILNQLIPLLRKRSSSQDLSNVVREILDRFSLVTARHPSNVQQLYSAIGDLPFLRTSIGSFCHPRDLFDPSDTLLKELYEGEPKFPIEPFTQPQYLQHLRQCGLRTVITPQDVVNGILAFAPSSVYPTQVDSTKLTRARATFKYLSKYPWELSKYVVLTQWQRKQHTLSSALTNLVVSRAWLPVCSTPPQGYPSALKWKGEGCTSHLTSLQAGSVAVYSSQGDTKSRKLPFVVGSQMYVVDLEVPLDLHVARIFTTDYSHLGTQIIYHLTELIATHSRLSTTEVSHVVTCIYQYLHDLWQTGCIQGLSFPENYIWIQEKHMFVSSQVVATKLNPTFRQDLQPYLYILPTSLRAYAGLFKACGVKEVVTRSQIVSVLGMVKDASRSLTDSQQAWQMVMSILTWLTDDGTKQVHLPKKDTLFVPVESSSAYPQLQEASEVVYSDIDFLRKFVTEMNFEDSRLCAIAHDRVYPKLAHSLGLVPLSEHLDISEDAFGDAGPNEPLTVRLKELLRDYKDGLTIIKELLQNADDAEATEVNICYDARSHTSDRSKLFFGGMAECHGPGLIVHNDQVFTDSDFENITKLGGATKQDKPLKIGKFGVGFCSVYHITDIPSFVSRDMLYVFDPTLKYLKNEIQNPSKPGKKIKTSTRVITHSRQLDPFTGLFGFRPGASYDGTMFRFPFRTQHSELSSTIYSERTVHDLIQSIKEAGSKLILFLQHVNSITFRQILPGDDAPTCLLRITKNNVKVDGLGTSARVVSVFVESSSTQMAEEQWLVNTKTGKICGKYSTASVACLLKGSLHKYVPKAIAGEVFCFLPLSLKTGLPVHVSSNFAVMSNRTGIWSSDAAAAKANQEVQWNVQLMQSVIPSAYFELLKTLKYMHQQGFLQLEEYTFHHLWPVGVELETHNPWFHAVQTLYKKIQDDELFYSRSTRQWLSLAKTTFLDHTLLCRSTETSIPMCVHEIVQHLHLPVVDLPTRFYIHLRVKGSTLTEKHFVKKFFDNISSLSVIWKARNEVLLCMVEIYNIEYKLHPERAEVIENYLKRRACIPCSPDGKELRKCTKILHPKAEFANLYDPEDGRFPVKEFADNHLVFSALDHLGMIHEFIPWRMLVERARSIKTLFNTDQARALKRVRLILQCIESNQKDKFSQKLTGSEQLSDVPFLPVALKPDSYPLALPWYGDNFQLVCGRQLIKSGPRDFKAKNVYLAGSQTCIVNEDKREGGEYIPYKIQQVLKIKQQPSTEQVVSHFKVLINTFISYQGDSQDALVQWITTGCSQIYTFLESQLLASDSPSTQVTSVPFVASSSSMPGQISQGYHGSSGASTVSHPVASKQRELPSPQVVTGGHHPNAVIDLQGLESMPCVWLGNRFIRPEHVAMESKVKGPYLFPAPPDLARLKRLTQALGIKERFAPEVIVKALLKMKKDFGDCPVDKPCQEFLHNIIADLDSIEASTSLKIMLPDIQYVMHWSKELAFNDAAWLPPEEGHIYVHSDIPRPLAEKLGVRLVRSKRLDKYVSQVKTFFGKGYPFGQREELTQRIQNILREYTLDETVLKELLQNADDAKAEKMYVILDKRTHEKNTVLSDEWRNLQGPALLVWNDKTFSERDLEGIQKLGLGSKRPDSETIGQYGIGFNVVYHLTDCPSFISGGDTLCIMDPHCRYIPEADQLNPGRRFDVDSQFWKDFPDMCSAYLQTELNGCPPELEGGSLFRFPLRHTYDMVRKSEIIDRQYHTDITTYVLDADRMHRCLRSWAPKMKQALLFLNHVKELRFCVIENNAMVTENCFMVRLDEAAQREREQLHEKVANFKEPRGSEPCIVRYTLDITEIRPKSKPRSVHHPTTNQDTTVADESTEVTEESWIIQQGIGDVKNHEQNWTYVKQVKPRHGLAAPLRLPTDGKMLFHGKVFCFLPLRGDSKLPVHVNGHFILNDSRQGLWANWEDQRGAWNRCLLDAISSSYANFLEHARGYYVQSSSYKDRQKLYGDIKRFYDLFPNWSSSDKASLSGDGYGPVLSSYSHQLPARPVAEGEWLELAKAVYQKLSKNNSQILASIHSRELQINEPKSSSLSDTSEANAPESSSFPESSKAAESHPRPKVEYSVKWHCLVSAIPAGQVHFWSTPPITKCNARKLRSILEHLGMSITCAPLRIRNHFEKVEVKVPKTLPETVFEYYAKFHRKIVPKVPCCIKDTKFETVDNFLEFTMYILKTRSDEPDLEFPQPPFNLPLLLTADKQLRNFDEKNKTIASKYSQLFPRSSEMFLHPSLLNVRYVSTYFSEPDGVSYTNIRDILSENLPPALQAGRVSDAAQWIDRDRLTKVWECLKADPVFSKHLQSILKKWALLPTSDNRLFHHGSNSLLPIIPPGGTSSESLPLSLHQILKGFRMPFLDVEIVEPDTVQAYCPQLSSHVSHCERVLQNLLHLHREEDISTFLTEDSLRLLIDYFKVINFRANGSCRKAITALPFFLDIGSHFIAITGKTAHIWPTNLCISGRDKWLEGSSVVFLSSAGYWKQLASSLEDLGIVEINAEEAYVKYIFPKFHFLSAEDRFQHLKHIRDNLIKANLFNMEYRSTNAIHFINALKSLHCIETGSGFLERPSAFYNHKRSIFIVFKGIAGQIHFLPRTFTEPEFECKEWLEFFISIGMRDSPTDEEFMKFCTVVAGGSHNNPRAASQVLLEFLFSKAAEDWHKNQFFLSQVSEIGFVCAKPVPELGWITAPCPTQTKLQMREDSIRMTTMKGSALDSKSMLVWTVRPIISLPYTVHVSYSEVLPLLHVLTKPTIEDVKQNVTNIGRSRYADFKLFDNFPADCKSPENATELVEVLLKCFEFISKNSAELSEQDCKQLSNIPCIPVPARPQTPSFGTVLVKPCQVISSSSSQALAYHPFLHCLPTRLLSVAEFLERIGVKRSLELHHVRMVLEEAHKCSGSLELDFNTRNVVTCCVAQLYSLLKDAKVNRNTRECDIAAQLQPLYLPTDGGQLHLSSDLLYRDTPTFKKVKVDTSEHGLCLLDLTNEYYDFHEEEFCHALPAAVRPKGLSHCCDQSLVDGYVEVHDSSIAEALKKTFQLESLPNAIMMIVKHKTSDDELCQNFRPILVEFVQTVRVRAIENLQTSIVLKEQQVVVGTARVDIHLQRDEASWHIYINSKLNHMSNAIVIGSLAEHLVSVMRSFCTTASDNSLEEVKRAISFVLCAETKEDLERFLDGEGLKLDQLRAEEVQFEARVSPKLGQPIPPSWVHRLDQHIDNIFSPEEWVGYEEEEENIIFAQVAYLILPDDDDQEDTDRYLPPYLRRYKIYTKEDDEEGREVSALDIYKFLRGLKPARPEPRDVGTRDLVVYEEDSDSARVREAGGQEELPDIKKIKAELCKQLLEIWKLPRQERDKAIRRLYFQWHPDKNPDNPDLAEEVFKFLQKQVEKLEAGQPLDDPMATEPTPRGGEYHSQYWSSYFTRWNTSAHTHRRSWQSENNYRQQRSSRTSEHPFDSFMHNNPRKNPEEASRWLKQAEHDHRALCVLFNEVSSARELSAHVCFMAHQVAEKALKGGMYALCGLGERNLKSHSLTPLAYALQVESYHLREGDLAQLVTPLDHKSYYLDTRYPNRHPQYIVPSDEYTPDDACQAKEAADLILDMIKKVVN